MEFAYSKYLTNISIRHEGADFINTSRSGSRIGISYGGGFWRIEAELQGMPRNIARRLFGDLNSLDGTVEPFIFRLPPAEFGSATSYNGFIQVKDASQTGKQITVQGLPINNQLILNKGDFVKFDNSNKVYLLTENLVSDSAGEGILHLNIPIVNFSPLQNELVQYRDVPFRVALLDRINLDLTNRDFIQALSINMREVWN